MSGPRAASSSARRYAKAGHTASPSRCAGTFWLVPWKSELQPSQSVSRHLVAAECFSVSFF